MIVGATPAESNVTTNKTNHMKPPIVREEPATFGNPNRNVIHNQECPNSIAAFAMDIMHHLAISTACPDGEDSAGRQKLKLLPPDGVAQRACEIADAAFREFEIRQWMIDTPLPSLKSKKDWEE